MNTTNFFSDLNTAAAEMLQSLNAFSEKELNEVPDENSWTAAEVAAHVTKSNASLVKAMCAAGNILGRSPEEKISELKTIFLNFSSKLKSPEFILPIIQHYEKMPLVSDLQSSFDLVVAIGQKTDLTEAICFPFFYQLSKWEVLHFIQYHTMRHNHQLQKIAHVIKRH